MGVGPPLYPTRWHIRSSWQLFKCLCRYWNFCIDGTPGGYWQPTEDDNMRCSRTTQVRHFSGKSIKGGQCCRSSCKWLLQVDHLQLSISHFWSFNAVKCCQTNTRDNGLKHREKQNTASQRTGQTSQRSLQTRHHEKSASLKLVQLAPRSFCHAVDGIWKQYWKSNFSRGELRKTSSRSAAPSALVSSSKHLECSREDGGGIQPPQKMAYPKRYVYAT